MKKRQNFGRQVTDQAVPAYIAIKVEGHAGGRLRREGVGRSPIGGSDNLPYLKNKFGSSAEIIILRNIWRPLLSSVSIRDQCPCLDEQGYIL